MVKVTLTFKASRVGKFFSDVLPRGQKLGGAFKERFSLCVANLFCFLYTEQKIR